MPLRALGTFLRSLDSDASRLPCWLCLNALTGSGDFSTALAASSCPIICPVRGTNRAKTAFFAPFCLHSAPFPARIRLCEHRHNAQKRPDARKNIRATHHPWHSLTRRPPSLAPTRPRLASIAATLPTPRDARKGSAPHYTTIASSSPSTSAPEVTSVFLRQLWHR